MKPQWIAEELRAKKFIKRYYHTIGPIKLEDVQEELTYLKRNRPCYDDDTRARLRAALNIYPD